MGERILYAIGKKMRTYAGYGWIENTIDNTVTGINTATWNGAF